MQSNYFDPFSVWKSFYTELEPKMSQSMQKWLESEEYAAFSGQLLKATLAIEQHFVKSMEQMLQTCNIPTMKDIVRIGELLVGLESKVDVLDERLVHLEKHVTGTEDVREQLAKIAAQLEAIGQQLPETPARNRRRNQKSEEGLDQIKLEITEEKSEAKTDAKTEPKTDAKTE